MFNGAFNTTNESITMLLVIATVMVGRDCLTGPAAANGSIETVPKMIPRISSVCYRHGKICTMTVFLNSFAIKSYTVLHFLFSLSKAFYYL